MAAHAGHTGKDSAIELLLEQAERIEPGLVVLTSRLRLDEHVEIDALLRDTLGYPVVVMLARGDIATELGRMAAVAGALQRGRYLLSHLFGERGGLDPSLRPRFVLLANRFPDNAGSLLDMMAGVEVQALEYRVVTSSVGRPVLDLAVFHRTSGPSYVPPAWRALETGSRPSAAPSAAPPPAAPSPLPPRAIPTIPSLAPRPGMTPSTTPAARPAATTAAALPASAPATVSPAAAAPSVAAPPAAPAKVAAAAAAAESASAAAGAAGNGVPTNRLPEAESPGGRRMRADGLQLLDATPSPPAPADGFFQRARESIRSLSSHVTESSEDGQVRYRVKDKTLATLILDPAGLRVRVGDQGGAGTAVADEATFNASLNSVFTLYFDRLGPDRPTA